MYFLAGVADVEIFKNNELIIEGKTLIESAITIDVSAEEIRAGKGATLYGKYFHSSNLNLKISDAMFKMEYLAANLGTDIELGGDITVEEHFIAVDEIGTCILKNTPVPLDNNSDVYVYWKHISDKFYKKKKIDKLLQGNIIELGETEIGEIYCVKYLYTNDFARKITICSEIIPDILSVYLKANIYSGTTTNINSGVKAGEITIKIPRFLLSGSQEILFNMTGAVNHPIEGIALACKRNCCDGSTYYAEIIEIIFGRKFDTLKGIKISSDEDMVFISSRDIEKKLKVYAYFDDSSIAVIKNTDIKFDVNDEDILTIDENGRIHPLHTGITKITASYLGIVDDIFVKVILQDSKDDYKDERGLLFSDNEEDVMIINDLEILLFANKQS